MKIKNEKVDQKIYKISIDFYKFRLTYGQQYHDRWIYQCLLLYIINFEGSTSWMQSWLGLKVLISHIWLHPVRVRVGDTEDDLRQVTYLAHHTGLVQRELNSSLLITAWLYQKQ